MPTHSAVSEPSAAHRSPWWALLWPRTLVGRVFGLYVVTFVAMLVLGLAMLVHHALETELTDTRTNADALLAVVGPIVAENAVTGEFDALRSVLDSAVGSVNLSRLTFLGAHGGRIPAVHPMEQGRAGTAPDWVRAAVEERMQPIDMPIILGGRTYGTLSLEFAIDRIAGVLWQQARAALVLGGFGLLLGLLLIRIPLSAWLEPLSDEGQLQQWALEDTTGRQPPPRQNSPEELQQAFAALDRAAATVRARQAQSEVTLAALTDAVFTLDLDGRILMANPAALSLAARAVQQVLGRSVYEVLPGALDGGAAGAMPVLLTATQFYTLHAPDVSPSAEPLSPWRHGSGDPPWPIGRWVAPAGHAGTAGMPAPLREFALTLTAVRGTQGALAGFVLVCHAVQTPPSPQGLRF